MNWKREITLRPKRAKESTSASDTGTPFWRREPRSSRRQASDAATASASAEPVVGADREPSAHAPGRARARRPVAISVPSVRRRDHVVGLKVGASQIAAARVANGSYPQLVQASREPLPAGIVVGGELRDPDALTEEFKRFFAKHRLPTRRVRLGIGNNRIGVRTFEISGIDDGKQLANAIRYQAQEALPIPIEDAVLDYQIVGQSVDNGVTTNRVLLTVAYREFVDRYVTACRNAGLHLIGVDLEAFALLRAFRPRVASPDADEAALVVVAVGHERTTLALSNGRFCEFTRVLDWGGSALDVAIARSTEGGPVVAALPPGMTLKEVLFEDENTDLRLPSDQMELAREAVRRELQAFGRELLSSLHFYQNQPGALPIHEVVLTGGAAAFPGLAESVQRQLGILTRVGNPLARATLRNGLAIPARDIDSLAVAIGLGIED